MRAGSYYDKCAILVQPFEAQTIQCRKTTRSDPCGDSNPRPTCPWEGFSLRIAGRRESILSRYDPRQRSFLEFVLSQYVEVGESELDTQKLPDPLELKYGTPVDAIRALGSVSDIRATFSGFQRGLYDEPDSG